MNFKIAFLLLITLLLLSCTKEVKKIAPKPYSVLGNVDTSFENNNARLLTSKNGVTVVIDSASIKNQQFYLQSKINSTKLYSIVVEGIKDTLSVVLSANPLVLTFQNTTIDYGNNVLQQQYTAFNTNYSKLDSVDNKNFEYATNFVKGNANSELATIVVSALKGSKNISFVQFRELFNNLDSVQQRSADGVVMQRYITTENVVLEKNKKITDSIALANKKARVIKRPLAPIFSGESKNGNDYSLRTLITNNKVVIIDFWASWCGPCRTSNPTLVRLYKKYKNKGLGILGVSEDKNKNAWKNAIAQDGLTWPQIIDDNQRISFMYNVTAIPHVIVLDNRGGFLRRKTSSGRLEADIIKLLNE